MTYWPTPFEQYASWIPRTREVPDVFASTLALAPIQSRFFATLEKTAPRVYDLNELVHVPSFSLRAQRIPFAKFSPFSSIAALRSRISWDDAVREGLIAHMQVDTSGDLWSLTTRTTPPYPRDRHPYPYPLPRSGPS